MENKIFTPAKDELPERDSASFSPLGVVIPQAILKPVYFHLIQSKKWN
jgi:hypothetical protein